MGNLIYTNTGETGDLFAFLSISTPLVIRALNGLYYRGQLQEQCSEYIIQSYYSYFFL